MADNLYINEIKPERALLVGVDTGDFDAQSSMDELWELAKSAGAEPIATKIQKRDSVKTGTCVGTGMVEEIAQFAQNNDIDVIIFDRELTPIQIRNLEDATGVRIIDRTMLILDIFALRAKTKEGKLQVEIAQLRYMMPRLTGRGTALSRLGGGIGTRGPGESKLETDRRHIRRRIENLKEALQDVEKNRAEINRRRQKNGTITCALVGYTNAGKSTLMNFLTDAGVLAEDKLFATLDPTARALKLPCGKNIMLIDTVGLVRRLPHHLVEAFKSTLEQAATADIILNVCDASSPEAQVHLDVTAEILHDLGSEDRPIIPVLNKWDKVDTEEKLDNAPRMHGAVRISALKGEGIDELLQAVEDALPEKNIEVEILLPFAKSGLAAEIRRDGTVISEEYVAEGLLMKASLDPKLYGKCKEFLTNPPEEPEEDEE
ncbi:MAG: GTPase HflX [Clostridia bacterium]|nr:GTPase HflX [Clostridia bacterium]